jgi:hypothetical protein
MEVSEVSFVGVITVQFIGAVVLLVVYLVWKYG